MKHCGQTVRLPSGAVIEFGEYGDRDGHPLLYFHGWPSSHFQARSLDAEARSRGIRVIAPNRPGIGKSSPQPKRTLADWPPLVLEFAKALGISKCPVLGVSGGGPYALATAAELPDLISNVGVACGAVPLDNTSARKEIHFNYRALLLINKSAPWLLPPLFRGGRWFSRCPPGWFPMAFALHFFAPADREALRDERTFEEVMVTYQQAADSGSDALISDANVYLETWNVDLAKIRCPAYFWHGEEDRNIPISLVKKLAQSVPNAHCQWFPEDGHFSLGFLKTGIFLDALFP